MERIPNLRPGAELSVFIYDEEKGDAVEKVAKLTPSGNFHIDHGVYGWDDLGCTPREAIHIHIRDVKDQIDILQKKIWTDEHLLKKKYPIHPVLSEQEFKKKYPNLHGSQRLEDHSPADLERFDSHAHWEAHRYDEPG